MAKGKVTMTNPPENKGVITIDGGTDTFNYNVKAGDTVGGYVPKVGDDVDFTPDYPGKRARGVAKVVPADQLGCTLDAAPDTVPAGGARVTLNYTTNLAVRASIQPNVGEVPVGVGSTVTEVKEETKFTITVMDDAGNSANSSVTVFVA
jgi:hypothetical protein